MYTHNIYNFLGIYSPIDWRFPCNYTGLCIERVDEVKGCIITGKLEDLDLSLVKSNLDKNKKIFLESLDICKKRYESIFKIKLKSNKENNKYHIDKVDHKIR